MLKPLALSGLILAALTALTAPALAQSLYDINPANCGSDTSDGRLRLTPDSFEFYESSCRVTDHKIVSQTASDLTFDCAGEGESWTRKLRAEVIDKGLRLTEDGVSVDYIACN